MVEHIGSLRYVLGLMRDLLRIAKILADPTRVRVLTALRGRELCVCELCDALRVSQSTLSTHLRLIREAGLARTRKEGKWIYYASAPGRERLTKSLFAIFASDLRKDGRLQGDARRLKKRLEERDSNGCCRGFEVRCDIKRKKRP